MSNELKIGVASAVISPSNYQRLTPTGMNRLVPTRGVLDDLRVEAMAIAAGDDLAFVITSDLRYYPRSWTVAVSEAVAAKTGCATEKVLFSSVHNHCSSPDPADDSDEAKAACDQANRMIIDQHIVACTEAWEALAPAEMAATSVEMTEPMGQNRRLLLDNGTCINAWGSGPVIPPGRRPVASAGPDSKRIDIFAARRAGHPRPMALMTSYASHPHLYQLPYFSGEVPGAAKRTLEQIIPGATCLYANHCGGDIDMHCVHPMPDDDMDQVLWFQTSAALLADRFANTVAPAVPTDGYVGEAVMRHEYYTDEKTILNVLAVGDIAFVSMPGELFITFGQQMLKNSPFAHTILMSYNGSTPGYTPEAIGFEQGSYEVMRGPSRPLEVEGVVYKLADENTGAEITSRVIDMLNRLHT